MKPSGRVYELNDYQLFMALGSCLMAKEAQGQWRPPPIPPVAVLEVPPLEGTSLGSSSSNVNMEGTLEAATANAQACENKQTKNHQQDNRNSTHERNILTWTWGWGTSGQELDACSQTTITESLEEMPCAGNEPKTIE